MKIYEYQAHEIFSSHGIPTPPMEVADSAEKAEEIAKRFGRPVAVKAQVLVGGRGKAGGIKIAQDPGEAHETASRILSSPLKGEPVREVLIQEALQIKEEYYLGITVDRSERKPVVMVSPAGGVEIEEVARLSPQKIFKQHIHPLLGFQNYQATSLAFSLCENKERARGIAKILSSLYHIFEELDSSLVEINPLVITQDEQLYALDAKIIIDDNALYRHPELSSLGSTQAGNPLEVKAKEQGLSYVHLDGEIGCIVNGAGLAMVTMDLVKRYGAEPANFLDVGGGASKERVSSALDIVCSEEKVKMVLVNIFGGITRCDVVADGLIEAISRMRRDLPLVIRLSGTNEEEGRRKLCQTRAILATTMDEAARIAVREVKK